MSATIEELEAAEQDEDGPADDTITDDDDDDDDDQEPETAQEPESATMSEKEMEAALDKLTKEGTRHANRISEIMGADAQTLAPCALCTPQFAGFYFPESVDDATRAAVLEAVGIGAAADLETEPGVQQCATCGGKGQTLTGSLVPEHRTKMCPECTGLGWTDPQVRSQYSTMRSLNTPPAPVLPASTTYTPTPSGMPNVDKWGRAYGHYLYGRDPEYMTAIEKQGDLPGIHS